MNEISNRELIVKKKKIAKSTTGAEATEKDWGHRTPNLFLILKSETSEICLDSWYFTKAHPQGLLKWKNTNK